MAVIDEISKAFTTQAENYERSAKVQIEVGERLLERLSLIKLRPVRILDLGCGTGLFSHKLSKMYPKSVVVSVDISMGMLQETKKKQSWFKKWPLVNANMQNLPFANQTFDLIFANQVIHWSSSLGALFRELNRIMNANGCLMFSTLGPDTFIEIKNSWKNTDCYSHVNHFEDMHDVGDLLMHEKFQDPVMDMEMLSILYPSVQDVLHSLKSQGVKNIHSQRAKGLMGKSSWNTFLNNYSQLQTECGKIPLSYEILYGHAWKGANTLSPNGLETFISVDQIKRL